MSLPTTAIATAAIAAIGAGALARNGMVPTPGPLMQPTHDKQVGMASLVVAAVMTGAGWYLGGKRRSNSIGRGLLYAGALNGLGGAALMTGMTRA